MTLSEFKARLTAEHAGQFSISQDGYIRHKTIRLESEAGDGDYPACPLAAIFGASYFDWSAKSGMSVRDQDAIMHAADGRYDSELRGWMLETLCGETT